MNMEKARSRLTAATSVSSSPTDTKQKPTLTDSFGWRPTRLNGPHSQLDWSRYRRHWPTGLIGLLGWVGVYGLLRYVHPTTIATWPLPESYGPLLLAVFVAITFSSAFLLLNTRRGLWLGLLVTIWVSLRLQAIELEWWQWLVFVTGVGGIEVVFSAILWQIHQKKS